MKKNKLTLIIVLVISALGMHDKLYAMEVNRSEVYQGIWRDVVGLYADESIDYLNTLQETQNELRFWRQKVLKERFDDRITKIESILSASNNDVLTQIEAYVKERGIDSLDDSLMMRIAQLNYDRANFDMTLKMRHYENELNQFNAGHRKKAPELPAPNYKMVIYYSAELLRRFPSSPLSDRAHYILGYCLYDEGKNDKAAKIYDRMLRLHGFSELAPEVRWRLAEYYFDAQKFDLALPQYKFLSSTKNNFTLKAFYKEGAIYFVQGKLKEASNTFLHLLNISNNRLGSGDPEAGTLNEEAFEYLAFLKAKNVDLQLDEDLDAQVTERLALAYRRIQDEEGSRKTYQNYVSQRPLAKVGPRFMNNVIQSFDVEELRGRGQEVRNRFITGLSPSSTFWVRYKSDVPTNVESQDLYEVHILASAEFYAEQARRSKSAADYRAAIEFYRRFIDSYPYSPLRSQAHFQMAELQYFAGRYSEAATTYMEVTLDENSDEFKDEAAYGFVLAESKRVGFPLQELKPIIPQRNSNGLLMPASAATQSEKAFLQAVENYVNIVNKGARRQKILYRSAEIFFTHNQFDKTRQALELVLRDKEPSSVSTKAIRLISHTYDLENNWEKVVETQNRLLGLSHSVDTESFESAPLLRADSPVLLSAWRLENVGKTSEAAEAYEQFVIYYPKSSDAAHALFRSGLLYKRAAQIRSSNRMFERLLKQYPSSQYVSKAEFLLAANYESIIQFEKAAKKFEAYSKKYPTGSLTAQALLNAATLRAGLHQYAESANDFSQYAKRMNDDELWFQAAEFHQKAGNSKQALAILKRYSEGKYGRDFFIRSRFEQAKITGNADRDCAAIEFIVKRYEKSISARSRHSLYGCLYLKTIPLRNELLSAKNVKGIESKIEALMQMYGAIQKTGDVDWISMALYDAGVVHENLADKFKSAEQKIKAVGFYKKVVELVDDSFIRPATQLALDKLKRLAPDQISLNRPESLWPLMATGGISPSVITVRWPSESSVVKIAFEQKKWNEVISTAEQEMTTAPATYYFTAKAHALAQIGAGKEAQETLLICVEKLNDPSCAAALLEGGYHGNKADELKNILEAALKNDSYAAWKMGLAHLAARRNQGQRALQLAEQAIEQDPLYAPTYSFVVKLLLAGFRPELAQITLNEGIKNTDGDESLQIQKGYLDLGLHLLDKARSLVEEFKRQEVNTPTARIYMAYALLAEKKRDEALALISDLPTDERGKNEILMAQFSLALLFKNQEIAKKRLVQIEPLTKDVPYASYLVGIYYHSMERNGLKAREYLSRAKELGTWSRWLELGLTIPIDNREPAEIVLPEKGASP